MNNYAIATDELATALQDGAAALQTAGNDLDEAIALTTAGNLITQDASKTGGLSPATTILVKGWRQFRPR